MKKKFAAITVFLAVFLLCLPGCNQTAAKSPASTPYDVAFSPYDNGLDLILSVIDSAEKSILVVAYSFTSKPVTL